MCPPPRPPFCVSGQFPSLLKNYTNDSSRREKETLLKIVAKKGVDVRVNESLTEIKKVCLRSLHIHSSLPLTGPKPAAQKGRPSRRASERGRHRTPLAVIVALFLLPSEVAKATLPKLWCWIREMVVFELWWLPQTTDIQPNGPLSHSFYPICCCAMYTPELFASLICIWSLFSIGKEGVLKWKSQLNAWANVEPVSGTSPKSISFMGAVAFCISGCCIVIISQITKNYPLFRIWTVLFNFKCLFISRFWKRFKSCCRKSSQNS